MTTDTQAAVLIDHLSLHKINPSMHDITRHDILTDISLAIPAGAVVGLVGRNGAGKSSLMRCLAGLTEPTSGSSTLFGCSSQHLGDAECARLGYVAQSADLFEWMTVAEHLDTIGRAYPRWSDQRCTLLATRLELPMLGKVSELSGGDKQKLSLVLALAHDPDLLLLDEPVANLDPLTRRAFMAAMFGNRADETSSGGRQGECTVIISSHILSDLERVVSHVAFLREGRLQLFDTWDAMLEHLRLVPATAGIPPAARVWDRAPSRGVIIDTRHAPHLADAGASLTLDELFLELNT